MDGICECNPSSDARSPVTLVELPVLSCTLPYLMMFAKEDVLILSEWCEHMRCSVNSMVLASTSVSKGRP